MSYSYPIYHRNRDGEKEHVGYVDSLSFSEGEPLIFRNLKGNLVKVEKITEVIHFSTDSSILVIINFCPEYEVIPQCSFF